MLQSWQVASPPVKPGTSLLGTACRAKGLPGLYQGFGMGLASSIAGAGVGFATYEALTVAYRKHMGYAPTPTERGAIAGADPTASTLAPALGLLSELASYYCCSLAEGVLHRTQQFLAPLLPLRTQHLMLLPSQHSKRSRW